MGRLDVRAMPARPDISALFCREGDAWWDPRSRLRGRVCIPAASLLHLPTLLQGASLRREGWGSIPDAMRTPRPSRERFRAALVRNCLTIIGLSSDAAVAARDPIALIRVACGVH